MAITVADVKKALPKYAALTDDQITKAMGMATGVLTGFNADWESKPKADEAHLLQTVSITLKLHFPQNASAYIALDNMVMDMVNSLWSSSNMIKSKNTFTRIVGEREE